MTILTASWVFATIWVGARNTLSVAVAIPTESGIFLYPISVFGQGAVVREATGMATDMFRTPCPPYTRRKVKGGCQSLVGDAIMSKSINAQACALSFHFENSPVNAVIINDEPWFFAKDVCGALNIDITQTRKLDEDEKGLYLIQTPSGEQNVSIVSESGLYTLVLRCRDAIKKGTVPHRFRKWVTSEVLPSIRKTGSYVATISAQQQYHIKEAVLEKARRTGQTHQSIYQGLYRVFKVPKYQDIPANRFEEALSYLNSQYPTAYETVEVSVMNLVALCSNMQWVYGWWCQYGSAIRTLNRRVASSVHDHFMDGSFVASSFISQHALDVASLDTVKHYPFDGTYEEKHDYYMLTQNKKR